jgi:hypothetical protein
LPFVEKSQTFASPNGDNLGDLFHTINIVANTWIEIVGRKLYGYYQYPIDVKTCKCALIWWWIEKHQFPIIVTLAK